VYFSVVVVVVGSSSSSSVVGPSSGPSAVRPPYRTGTSVRRSRSRRGRVGVGRTVGYGTVRVRTGRVTGNGLRLRVNGFTVYGVYGVTGFNGVTGFRFTGLRVYGLGLPGLRVYGFNGFTVLPGLRVYV